MEDKYKVLEEHNNAITKLNKEREIAKAKTETLIAVLKKMRAIGHELFTKSLEDETAESFNICKGYDLAYEQLSKDADIALEELCQVTHKLGEEIAKEIGGSNNG